MTQRGIIGRISIVTIASFLVLFLILFRVDPTQANFLQFSSFYLSMLVFLWGLFFLIEFFVKHILKKSDWTAFYQALLHGGLLASLLLGLLMLQHLGSFTIINVSLLFTCVVTLELIFSKG